MKHLFAALVLTAATVAAQGASLRPTAFELLRSINEFENISTWMERIERQPDTTGVEFARYFRILAPHEWPKRYETEIKALVLLAYYVEFERVRCGRGGGDWPTHAESERHLRHYRTVLHPTSDRSDACVMTSAAHVFAMSFLRRMEELADPVERTRLYQQLIGTGRRFWTEHLLEQLFVRAAPTYDQIVPLLSFVQARDFARVARALATHGWDFRFAATALNALVRSRQSKGPWPIDWRTADARCDQILRPVIENPVPPAGQNSAD